MSGSQFSIDNIPFGIASSISHPAIRVATRFEDCVIFLDELAKEGLLLDLAGSTIDTFSRATLNSFAALPKEEQRAVRRAIQSLLAKPIDCLPESAHVSISEATLYLPVSIGGFTDFSCSRDHVLNAAQAVFGRRELPPGFEHFPVGYNGRASSIVVSGTPIRRPNGQFLDGKEVRFGATRRMDYELEVACVIGKPTTLGEPVKIEHADDHIFGLLLLNDWSARDIQALEMNPLGPFNGKSFCTSISPWVITLEALATFKEPPPVKNPDVKLASYLQDSDPQPSFNISLRAEVQSSSETYTLCSTNMKALYWTIRDLVAHQTVNGCSLNTGDILATGTVSGSTPESHGCLMESARSGGISIVAENGVEMKKMWLEDGDIVTLSGIAGEGIGFGDCVGEILPATQ